VVQTAKKVLSRTEPERSRYILDAIVGERLKWLKGIIAVYIECDNQRGSQDVQSIVDWICSKRLTWLKGLIAD
jgi:hypothetical protein